MLSYLLIFAIFQIDKNSKGRDWTPFKVFERPLVVEKNDRTDRFRISKEKPSTYILFEKQVYDAELLKIKCPEVEKKSNSYIDESDVWLRLYNNSLWAIKIRTYSTHWRGKNSEVIEMRNGRRFFILPDMVEVSLCFHVWDENGHYVQSSNTDSYKVSWVAPGRSILFSVPKKYLTKGRKISVFFNYEWEEGQSYSANLDPVHHIEFHSYRLPEGFSNE